MCVCSVGVGAGPAGPVLAGPLFRQFNFIDIFKNCARTLRAPIEAGPLQKSFLCPCVKCVRVCHVCTDSA